MQPAPDDGPRPLDPFLYEGVPLDPEPVELIAPTLSSSERSLRLISLSLGVLSAIAVGAALMALRGVLLPFVVAVFLTYLCRPLYVTLRRRRVAAPIALGVVVMAISLVFVLIGALVASSIEQFIDALPRYQDRLEGLAGSVVAMAQDLSGRAGVRLEDLFQASDIELGPITSALQTGLGSLVGFFSNAFVILLYVLFMLAGTGALSRKVQAGFKSGQAETVAGLIRTVDAQIRQYLVTKALISAGVGAMVVIILLLFGVDFALLWGFLTFLLNFIPNIGSLVATLLPFLVALVQFSNPLVAVILLVLLVTVQGLTGNVIEPRLFAQGLDLSPLLVLFALVFWGWLWGVWGMVLAVPLTAIIKIAFENVKALAPLAALMGN